MTTEQIKRGLWIAASVAVAGAASITFELVRSETITLGGLTGWPAQIVLATVAIAAAATSLHLFDRAYRNHPADAAE